MQSEIDETLQEAERVILVNRLRRFDESSRGHRKLETMAAERARLMSSSGRIANEDVKTFAEIEERKLEIEQAVTDSQELLDLLERRLFFLKDQLEKAGREIGRAGKKPVAGAGIDSQEHEMLLQKQIEFVDAKKKYLAEDINKMEKLLQSLDQEERSLET